MSTCTTSCLMSLSLGSYLLKSMCLTSLVQYWFSNISDLVLWFIKNLQSEDLRLLLYSVSSYYVKVFQLVQGSGHYNEQGDKT